jgi:hypothetical protein
VGVSDIDIEARGVGASQITIEPDNQLNLILKRKRTKETH